MAEPKQKRITEEEWEKKLNDVKIRKEDMNKLVMNFFFAEGYVEPIEKFAMESGNQNNDLAAISEPAAIIRAVHYGDIEDAIKKLNNLNPEESFLKELELTIYLLAFGDLSDCLKDFSVQGELLSERRRLETAIEVNAAYLQARIMKKRRCFEV